MYLVGVIIIIMVPLGKAFDEFNDAEYSQSDGDFPIPAIIGGSQVTLKEFPFAARLYSYPTEDITPPFKYTCTVEILHPSLVITAANCIQKNADMVVVAGEANQDDYKKGINVDKYKQYVVEECFLHPQFNPITNKHDVAILELSKPMTHRGFTIVPVSYDRLQGQAEGIILGWGGTESNPLNNDLFAKNLTVEICTKQITGDYEFICLVEPGMKGGDSGGPIIVNGKLIGIASHFHSSLTPKAVTNYYYTALWEEQEFLEMIIDKNGASSTESLLYLAMASVTFIK